MLGPTELHIQTPDELRFKPRNPESIQFEIEKKGPKKRRKDTEIGTTNITNRESTNQSLNKKNQYTTADNSMGPEESMDYSNKLSINITERQTPNPMSHLHTSKKRNQNLSRFSTIDRELQNYSSLPRIDLKPHQLEPMMSISVDYPALLKNDFSQKTLNIKKSSKIKLEKKE